MSQPLLSVRISVDYPGRRDVLKDVAFEVSRGEIFGLSGESGAGKSTIALAVPGLVGMRGGTVRGEILFDGKDLVRANEKELRRIRGREISLVLQSPVAALNPALRLQTQFREAWCAHSGIAWKDARPDVRSLLSRMGLPGDEEFLTRYPAQMSIGQAQRVVIAMAVLHKPKLIIADEPTSALDAASRAEILSLFRRLNSTHGTTILYISHDLDSMSQLCDRVGQLEPGGSIRIARHGISRTSLA
jgi:peptide/nickel transport system ATP-binding protein